MDLNMSIERRKDREHSPGRVPGKNLLRQQLKDLQHRVQMQVGSFLVLAEEGSIEQVALAQSHAKSALLKFGPDMHKLAQTLGDPFPALIDDYLDSVDSLLHSPARLLDEAKIHRCYDATQALENKLS